VKRIGRALVAAAVAQALLLVWVGRVAPDPPASPPLTLRFVTFNLLHGGIFSELSGDGDGLETRLRITVEGLRALRADVVGLQEASTGRRRGDVAARLARSLGYRYVQAPAAYRPLGSEHVRRGVRALLGFAEGPAVLSRFPIVRWASWELPPCGRPFDVRVLILAELETPAGPLAAFSAHTSGEPCHTRAVAALVRAKAGPLPAVVMGDFNAADTSPAMRVLTREAGWVDAFRHVNPTASGFTDGQEVDQSRPTAAQRIDYVLLVPGARIPGRILASRVVLDEPRGSGAARWASDHYGVLADIALEDPPASRPASGESG
jgi:endonuclease/exonuclease/phosphatase family metal-dependent hydrolase